MTENCILRLTPRALGVFDVDGTIARDEKAYMRRGTDYVPIILDGTRAVMYGLNRSEAYRSIRENKEQKLGELEEYFQVLQEGRISYRDMVPNVHRVVAEFLEGLHVDFVRESADKYYESRKSSSYHVLYPRSVGILRVCKEADRSVVFLTASPQIYVDAMNEALLRSLGADADFVIGPEQMTDDNHFIVCYNEDGSFSIERTMRRRMDTGKDKLDALKTFMEEHDIDRRVLRRSIAVGDSSQDTEFLSYIKENGGEAYIINPSEHLERIAREREFGLLADRDATLRKLDKVLYHMDQPGLGKEEADVNGVHYLFEFKASSRAGQPCITVYSYKERLEKSPAVRLVRKIRGLPTRAGYHNPKIMNIYQGQILDDFIGSYPDIDRNELIAIWEKARVFEDSIEKQRGERNSGKEPNGNGAAASA